MIITQDEWMKAVLEYRKAVAKDRADIEFRSRLRQTSRRRHLLSARTRIDGSG
jgi:hypothetical protein